MQDMDATLERFHRLAVISPEFIGARCLPLKHGGHGLDGVAIFELVSERVIGEFRPGLLFVVAQSGIEEGLEMRERRIRGETHIFRPVGERGLKKAQFGALRPRIDAEFVVALEEGRCCMDTMGAVLILGSVTVRNVISKDNSKWCLNPLASPSPRRS